MAVIDAGDLAWLHHLPDISPWALDCLLLEGSRALSLKSSLEVHAGALGVEGLAAVGAGDLARLHHLPGI